MFRISILLLLGLTAGASALRAQRASPSVNPTIELIETTADQSELLVHKQLAFSAATPDTGKVRITLDPATIFQTMDGFGASLTDSSAALLSRLPADRRLALLHQVFDPAGPLGLTLLRQPIGASDFSSKGDYSYDDPPGKQPDPTLTWFSVKPDEAYLFPMLREAEHLNPQLRVMVLPWSAPAWMKSGHTMRAGSLADPNLEPYARYLARTVEAYAQQGVPVWALALQNEPLNENPSYPTQRMLPDQEAHLAAALVPLLSRAGRAPLVLGYEHNWDDLDYPAKLLNIASTLSPAPLFAGIGFHCYAAAESAQAAFLARHPGTSLWFTECSAVNHSPFNETFLWQGRHLLLGAPNNGARSVMLWNILLDPDGNPHNGGCKECTALLTLERDGTAKATAGFYLLAHAAPFVHPGAHRIAATVTGAQDLLTSAYRNPDGTFATLLLNLGQSSTPLTVSLGNDSIAYTMPPQALATLTWGTPVPAVSEGTWRLAVTSTRLLTANPGRKLSTAAPSADAEQLWTVRLLPSGRFEIRNVLTAQALAVDRAGHLATLSITGAQVAALALHAAPRGFCIQLPNRADCASAQPTDDLSGNALLQLMPAAPAIFPATLSDKQ